MQDIQKRTDKPEGMLTAEELAERLGLEPETIRRWAVSGLIPSYRCGKRVVRFDYDEVKQVMRNIGYVNIKEIGGKHAK